jgi:2-oxoglutarate ferredoxin oxidoreductase subunit beta
MNPISATLGVSNASFVAQTGDWVPAHLYATILAAHRHRGFAFVRVLQRCPQYTTNLFDSAMRDPGLVELMVHPSGIMLPELDRIYKNQVRHDPADLHEAQRLADADGKIRLGVFYRNEELPVYEETRAVTSKSASEKVALLNKELDRHAV